MSESVPLYDAFADRYDLMINWEARLARESPFFQELFKQYEVHSVLDAASGTGRHAALFSSWGLEVAGADPSAEMVRVSRMTVGDAVRFVQAGFGQLSEQAGTGFDAVVCLGNSLPHLLKREEIANALRDMSAALRPGGLLVIHNNNYDRILHRKERFMPLASAVKGNFEYLFFRFFDFEGEILQFNIATFIRDDSGWRMHIDSTKHRAFQAAELEELLAGAHLKEVQRWGSFNKEPYQKEDSDNLIIVAIREGSL